MFLEKKDSSRTKVSGNASTRFGRNISRSACLVN